ncbi:hypothetical protein, partial [Sporisorium scitamineum]
MTVLLEGEMPEGQQSEDEDVKSHGNGESISEHVDDPSASRTALRQTRDRKANTERETAADEEDEQLSAEEEEESDDHSDGTTDDDEQGSSEEEEEDVEPSLKYSRVKGGVSDVLKRDTASAFALSPRFMALGTHGGMIYILDIDGNLVKGFRLHTASILDLVIDNTSDFVAAASMDGLVSISALATAE